MPALPDIVRDLLSPRQTFTSSDFDNNFNDVKNTVNTGRTVVTVGAIIGIVIAVVSVTSFCIAGCCIYKKQKERHRKRQMEAQKYTSSGTYDGSAVGMNAAAPGITNYGFNYGAGPGYGYGRGYAAVSGGEGGVTGINPAHTADHHHDTHYDSVAIKPDAGQTGTGHHDGGSLQANSSDSHSGGYSGGHSSGH